MCYTNQTKCQVHILINFMRTRASVRLFVLGGDVFTDLFQVK